jgi:Na+/H+ antiporter NhaD/arsenite permease-like protein
MNSTTTLISDVFKKLTAEINEIDFIEGFLIFCTVAVCVLAISFCIKQFYCKEKCYI